MASGDRSQVTVKPSEKITLAQAQALIESKARELHAPLLVTTRFAFGLSLVALAVSLIALTVALVR